MAIVPRVRMKVGTAWGSRPARDVERADRILFEGVLDPVDGNLHPNADTPGRGLSPERTDAERLRIR